MSHALEAALDVDPVVAEGRLRFGLRLRPEPLDLARGGGLAHAPAAAAGLRLEHHRVADRLGDAQRLGRVAHRAVRPGDDRDADLLHRDPRRGLVVESREHVRRRTDEDEPVLLADLGEVRVLGEEAVPRMDRLRAREERRGHDRGNVQIRLAGVCRSDADRLVGEMHRKAVRVGLAVDGDRLDAELTARADHAHGDLPAICDEDLVDRGQRGASSAIENRLPSVSTAVARMMPSPARDSGRFTILPPAPLTAEHAASMSST